MCYPIQNVGSTNDSNFSASLFLRSLFDELAKILANSDNDDSERSPTILATCALRFLHDSTPDSLTSQDHDKIRFCLDHRYTKERTEIPSEIRSLYTIMELDQTEQGLYIDIRRAGAKVTASVEAAKTFLAESSDWTLDEGQISGALLFIILNPDWQPYNANNFLIAVQEVLHSSIDWQEVINGFRGKVALFSKQQFLDLYNALLPLAAINPDFDIQAIWRGPYKSMLTHLSLLNSFLSCLPSELDIEQIPRLHRTYDPDDALGLYEGAVDMVERAKRDPTVSSDAVIALLDLIIPADLEPTDHQYLELAQIVGDKLGFFLCSASFADTTSPARYHAMRKLLQYNYLSKERPDYQYVLHTIWSHDKRLIAGALMDAHGADPLELTAIFDLGLEFDWLEGLLTMTTGFGFDLAALAHRKGLLGFTEWSGEKLSIDKNQFVIGLSKFAIIKAQDELRISRDEQPEPRTVSLAMQTAYDMLSVLDQHMPDAVELKALQRTFLQAYPRLILLCEGIMDDIDVDCKQSNAMPRSADVEMQELYKRMYGNELDVSKVIEYLQECKESADSSKRDLFACMIHGLFDEYSCFSEYPIDPLSKTAVLFGGIIQVGLISDLTLRIARDMVLDALREYPKEASMHKFGLQASQTFASRLQEPEWSEYCRMLVQIPNIYGTQIFSLATEALSRNGIDAQNDIVNGNVDRHTYHASQKANGDAPSQLPFAATFKSINPGPEMGFEEPEEEVKDQIVFFFNNVSQHNLNAKFDILRNALQESHHIWFADFLVNGRAKVEPNYQPLYLEVLHLLNSKGLWSAVLRATLFIVQKLFNAETTMQSASERKNLKSLAIWLGSLTLAQDKPVKRRNIAFLDLLLEGYHLEKLLLVIPFVCNVVAQGKHSTVFKPPNPWVSEILAALVELYNEGNITTNQKFDIEVLFDELATNIKDIEPSHILSERLNVLEPSSLMLPDGIRTFESLSLGINGNVQNPKFEVAAMQLDLPDLSHVLKFPPPSGSVASQTRLREVVTEAVTHAVYEIIGSVVERSVTIAAIAAASLIHKDFSCEEDAERLREASQRSVRELASSLALVTSKEPLRTSMTNYIRKVQAESPAEQAFPEGTILMCINDNLDIACEIVENKAADQAMPELEAHIQRETEARTQWRLEKPGEPYVGPAHSAWSTKIPEPYSQIAGGLRPEQLAIYSEFGRQPRGPPSHAQTASGDSGRQLPDVLQDTFASVSQLPNTSENPALSHHAIQPHQFQSQRSRIPPASLAPSSNQPQTNGFQNISNIEEQIDEMLSEIMRILLDNEGRTLEDIRRDTPLYELVEQIKHEAFQHQMVAMACAENICKSLYGEPHLSRPLAEIFVYILAVLYQSFPQIQKEVFHWANNQLDEKLLNIDVTIELLRVNILQTQKVDEAFASLILKHDKAAVKGLSNVIDDLWHVPRSAAFRVDFARSLAALATWRSEDPNIADATNIWKDISGSEKGSSSEEAPNELGLIRKHQINYVFSEWVRLCEESRGLNEKTFAAFVAQMHLQQLIDSPEDVATFLRLCIDAAVSTFEFTQREEQRGLPVDKSLASQFNEIDWLARLVVFQVKAQGEHNGSASRTKIAYMDSLLSIITLIMNHHQVTRGDNYKQRVFLRLYSSILNDWHEYAQETPAKHEQMQLVFAENILVMGPHHFPGFVHSWLTLISHRYLMPTLLKSVSQNGPEAFARIMETALSFVSKFLGSGSIHPAALDLYRGLLRILLVLHHDYPTFLADNHYRLCNAVPVHATQLLNILLSACPPRFIPVPNPFVAGLKIDRLDEIRESPRINSEYADILDSTDIVSSLDLAMGDPNLISEETSHIIDAIYLSDDAGVKVDSKLIHSIVLYIGQRVIAASNGRGSAFDGKSSHGILLSSLFSEMRPDARFQLICSIVNQLRWHNAHTHFFAYALLHLFGTDTGAQDSWDGKQQIIAVLLERIHAVLPHPWGLIVVLLELLKNPLYGFWQLPVVKSSPQVSDN